MPWIAPIIGGAIATAGQAAQGAAASDAASQSTWARWKWSQLQDEETKRMHGRLGDFESQAGRILGQGAAGQRDALGQGYGAATGALEQGLGQATGYVQGGQVGAEQAFGQGQQAISQGQAGAMGSLAGGVGGAAGALNPAMQLAGQFTQGATQAVGGRDITQAPSRLAQAYDQGVDLQSNPAYQARMDAALGAVERMSAAKGGRGGSAAQEAMMGTASRLAGQEYENQFQRAAQTDAQQQGLLNVQAGREQQAAMQAQANQMGLAGLGYQTQGQMAGMLYGAGVQGAGLQMQGAGMQAGMAGNIAQSRLGTAGQLGQMAYGTGAAQAGYGMQHGGQMADVARQQQQGQFNLAQMGYQGREMIEGDRKQALAEALGMTGQGAAATANTMGTLAKMGHQFAVGSSGTIPTD